MKMEKPMTEAEYRLAELIWEAAPIGSGELVQLCTQRLGWKKSTTYTMLRKLCALGVAKTRMPPLPPPSVGRIPPAAGGGGDSGGVWRLAAPFPDRLC